MSWVAAAWAKNIGSGTQGEALTATEKLCLLTLSDYHDEEEGYAWPSMERLARQILVSTRQTRSVLRSLEEKGLVVSQTRRRPNGAQSSNRYFLAIPGYDLPHRSPLVHLPPRGAEASNRGEAEADDMGGGSQLPGEAEVETRGGGSRVPPGAEVGFRPRNIRRKIKETLVEPSTTKGAQPTNGLVVPPEAAAFHRVLSPLESYQPTDALLRSVAEYSTILNLEAEADSLADWCRRKKAPASNARIRTWLKRATTEVPYGQHRNDPGRADRSDSAGGAGGPAGGDTGDRHADPFADYR